MPRLHLFEFGDLPWFPLSIRRQGMELLASGFEIMQSYRATAPVILDLLDKTNSKTLVVLAAGSGGGINEVMPHLPSDVTAVLTDIFPDPDFKSTIRLRYHPVKVDAIDVPAELKGPRIMYTAFHHFRPPLAKRLLEAAVNSNEPIAIFEVTERTLRGLLTILLLPFVALVLTPFVKPFRITRYLWTYIVPIIPLFVLFDGFVSALRTYDELELRELTKDLSSYTWTFEKLKGPTLERPSAFVGWPKSQSSRHRPSESPHSTFIRSIKRPITSGAVRSSGS